MKENNRRNIVLFGPGGCLTQEAVHLYIDHKLTEKEQRKIERHTSGCELCKDALSGAYLFKSGNNYSQRIYNMKNSPWRKSFETTKSSRKLFVGLSSAAASILLLLGILYSFHLKKIISEENNKNQISAQSIISIGELRDSMLLNNYYSEVTLNENIKRNNVEEELLKSKFDEKEIARPQNKQYKEEQIAIDQEYDIQEDYDIDSKVLEPLERVNADNINRDKPQHKILTSNTEVEESSELKKKDAGTFLRGRLSRKKTEGNNKYYVAEILPIFRGGDIDDFNDLLKDSIKATLNDTVINQSIIVGFRINTEGKISNVKLVSGTSSKMLNDRVIKMVKNSKGWVPAYLKGKPIPVNQELEIVLGKE